MHVPPTSPSLRSFVLSRACWGVGYKKQGVASLLSWQHSETPLNQSLYGEEELSLHPMTVHVQARWANYYKHACSNLHGEQFIRPKIAWNTSYTLPFSDGGTDSMVSQRSNEHGKPLVSLQPRCTATSSLIGCHCYETQGYTTLLGSLCAPVWQRWAQDLQTTPAKMLWVFCHTSTCCRKLLCRMRVNWHDSTQRVF